MSPPPGHPVLTCAEARALEARLFGGDEAREWDAMRRAGAAVAAAALRDFEEIGGFPPAGRVLVLAGKGHNGGDALLAARAVLDRHPAARADVAFAFGPRALRPLAQRAWRELAESAGERVRSADPGRIAGGPFALCLDGVFGFPFRPPVPAGVASLFEAVGAMPIGLRAAVDLPSGLGEGPRSGPAFRADFTYATGSVKAPAVDAANGDLVGRLRYLDLGFFDSAAPEARVRILTADILAPLGGLRPPLSDKRSFGHLAVVGGSRRYPGAVLMTVLAALRSGAGLVTAFVPESLAPAFAARAPEAMWVGLPETSGGGLARAGAALVLEHGSRASALALGPGLGRDPESLAMAADLVAASSAPLVIDADALRPEIVRAGTAPRVLTPHAGEFQRLRAAGDLFAHPPAREAALVLKGRLTAVAKGDLTWHSPFGGPVLARGGSGDLLTGLVGGLAAQSPADLALAACRGVVWHGRAADLLARARGQAAVTTTQVLDFLPQALRPDPETNAQVIGS